MNHSLQENSLEFGLPAANLPASLFADERKSSVVGEKYVAFSQGKEFYAVSSKFVVEVTASLAVAPLPQSPRWLHGIANLRGEIISVLNLPFLFGKLDLMPAPKSKFIVLRSQAFEFGVAFAADRLNEIVTLPEDKIQLIEDKDSPFIFGRAVHQSNDLNLIDMDKLLASLVV